MSEMLQQKEAGGEAHPAKHSVDQATVQESIPNAHARAAEWRALCYIAMQHDEAVHVLPA